jgi:anaerobic magnesium-protoporphyrin IX monomethyl ester cyclase
LKKEDHVLVTGNSVVLLNLPPSVDFSYTNKGAIYPGVAIILLGTLLKKAGYDVTIIDGAYDENYLTELETCLRERNVLFVGMSVMTMQIPLALQASKVAKECNENIPVVWGGPHPTLFPEQTVNNENVDIVAINEGTVTVIALAQYLQQKQDLSTIDGIGYKTGDSISITPLGSLDDIKEQPFLDFSLIDTDRYLHSNAQSVYGREFPDFKDRIRVMPILTGLGCPYKCEFCINPILKRRYRFRSAESIVSEIKILMEKYDVNTFFFLDEDFFVNKKRALDFITLVQEAGLHFNWRMWSRVDHFKPDYINKGLIKKLTDIGYGSIPMGAESGNQEILNDLKKGITLDQIKNSLNILTGTKIVPRYSFMVGLENENLQQIKNTYKFCMDMTRINARVDIAGPFIFRLYPGSPIFNRLMEKYNIKIPDSLDAWIEHLKSESSYMAMPWTPRQFQKILRFLDFYSTYALSSHMKWSWRLDRMIDYVWHKLSRFRLKHFFFSFPFEYWTDFALQKVYHSMKGRG